MDDCFAYGHRPVNGVCVGCDKPVRNTMNIIAEVVTAVKEVDIRKMYREPMTGWLHTDSNVQIWERFNTNTVNFGYWATMELLGVDW